jgi:hypothetical protein
MSGKFAEIFCPSAKYRVKPKIDTISSFTLEEGYGDVYFPGR